MTRKHIRIIITSGLFLIALALPANAEGEVPPGFGTQLEASGAQSLPQALPEETQDTLRELGIDGIDLYGLLQTSPRDVIGVLLGMLQGELGSTIMSGVMALATVLMLSFVFAALPEDEKTRHTLETAGSMLALLTLLPGLGGLMRGAAAVVHAGSDFCLLLIPILAGVITAAGNPSLALSYHTLTFAAAQGLSQLADGVIVPCSGLVLGLSLVDGAAKDAKLSAVAGAVKKAVIGTFAILAGLFSALLSIKSLIANTADALVVRGVKVVTGSIPLVGGALSEACGAILSSVSLVKGAVGGWALFAALLLYAPVLIELLLWSAMLGLLAAAAELFAQERTAGMFKSAAYAVSILTACVVFSAALLVISTGLVITIGRG